MAAPDQIVFTCDPTELPSHSKERHDVVVDMFGQFIFWLRNWSLTASKTLIKSEEAREKLGTIRRRYYDGVAALSPEQQDAAMLLVEETLNGFCERLCWGLGDEGTDARINTRHAYRFRIEIEIVDVATNDIVVTEPVNRGGKFFGKNWGSWLNRFRSK